MKVKVEPGGACTLPDLNDACLMILLGCIGCIELTLWFWFDEVGMVLDFTARSAFPVWVGVGVVFGGLDE